MTSIFRIYKVIRIKCRLPLSVLPLNPYDYYILPEHGCIHPQFESCSNAFITRRLGRPKLSEPGPAPVVGQIV